MTNSAGKETLHCFDLYFIIENTYSLIYNGNNQLKK